MTNRVHKHIKKLDLPMTISSTYSSIYSRLQQKGFYSRQQCNIDSSFSCFFMLLY